MSLVTNEEATPTHLSPGAGPYLPLHLSNSELNAIAILRLDSIRAQLKAAPGVGGGGGSSRYTQANAAVWKDIAEFENIIARIYGPCPVAGPTQ